MEDIRLKTPEGYEFTMPKFIYDEIKRFQPEDINHES
jgi:hypothetical protein